MNIVRERSVAGENALLVLTAASAISGLLLGIEPIQAIKP